MSYLHGSETLEIDVAGQTINLVLSSVVGVIGLAPKGPVNALKLITSPANAVEVFGSEVPGFSLPEALAAHFAEGGGPVLCINVFNASANLEAVGGEAVTVVNGRVVLSAAPVGGLTVFTVGGAMLTLGTDYKVNAYGVLTILNRAATGGYPDGTALRATYSRLAPATVTSAQLIGGTDEDNQRTGMALFELAQSTYGFNAKILIAPGYSVLSSVAAKLEALATKYRAVALIDAPKATTLSVAIAGRGPVDPLGGFSTTSPRVLPCYPYLQRPDPAAPTTDANPDPQKLVPFSAIMAGVISNTDNTLGFWYSPSSKKMQGVTGAEIRLSAAINDRTTDVQQLNAAGIATVFSAYGTGYLSFGNRSAAFPTDVSIQSFLCVRRTADIIEESIEMAWLPFSDLPTNVATIDAVRASVNTFLRDLISRGAIIDGTCEFLKEDNPTAQLAAGNPVFSYSFVPPPPMERGTFKAKLDTSLLRKLVS